MCIRERGSGLPKWIFAFSALLGCAMIGLSYAASLSRRVMTLRAWRRALLRLEVGLSYRSNALAQMLYRAAETEENIQVQSALMGAASYMQSNPLATCQQAMAMQTMEDLTAEDKTALLPCWEGLGAGTAEEQEKLLDGVQGALKVQLSEAEEKEQKNRQLAASLGIIGGLALFMMLI